MNRIRLVEVRHAPTADGTWSEPVVDGSLGASDRRQPSDWGPAMESPPGSFDKFEQTRVVEAVVVRGEERAPKDEELAASLLNELGWPSRDRAIPMLTKVIAIARGAVPPDVAPRKFYIATEWGCIVGNGMPGVATGTHRGLGGKTMLFDSVEAAQAVIDKEYPSSRGTYCAITVAPPHVLAAGTTEAWGFPNAEP